MGVRRDSPPGAIYLEKVNNRTDNKDSSSGSSMSMNLHLLRAPIRQLLSQSWTRQVSFEAGGRERHIFILLMNSSARVWFWNAERTPQLACSQCSRGELFSSRVVLARGANSTARLVVEACEAQLSAHVTCLVFLRETNSSSRA
ncbi:hypothetical protein ACLB2K_042703 [Fragaria x ananassa]